MGLASIVEKAINNLRSSRIPRGLWPVLLPVSVYLAIRGGRILYQNIAKMQEREQFYHELEEQEPRTPRPKVVLLYNGSDEDGKQLYTDLLDAGFGVVVVHDRAAGQRVLHDYKNIGIIVNRKGARLRVNGQDVPSITYPQDYSRLFPLQREEFIRKIDAGIRRHHSDAYFYLRTISGYVEGLDDTQPFHGAPKYVADAIAHLVDEDYILRRDMTEANRGGVLVSSFSGTPRQRGKDGIGLKIEVVESEHGLETMVEPFEKRIKNIRDDYGDFNDRQGQLSELARPYTYAIIGNNVIAMAMKYFGGFTVGDAVSVSGDATENLLDAVFAIGAKYNKYHREIKTFNPSSIPKLILDCETNTINAFNELSALWTVNEGEFLGAITIFKNPKLESQRFWGRTFDLTLSHFKIRGARSLDEVVEILHSDEKHPKSSQEIEGLIRAYDQGHRDAHYLSAYLMAACSPFLDKLGKEWVDRVERFMTIEFQFRRGLELFPHKEMVQADDFAHNLAIMAEYRLFRMIYLSFDSAFENERQNIRGELYPADYKRAALLYEKNILVSGHNLARVSLSLGTYFEKYHDKTKNRWGAFWEHLMEADSEAANYSDHGFNNPLAKSLFTFYKLGMGVVERYEGVSELIEKKGKLDREGKPYPATVSMK